MRVDFVNRIAVNFITFGAVTPTALLLENPTAAGVVIVAVAWGFLAAGFG